MPRIHPNAISLGPSPSTSTGGEPVALTVWRKSLLFNCEGFTVFNASGDLVYRVDRYSSSSKGEIILMDAAGIPLLAIRRKKLCIGERWLIHEGEETTNPLFAMRKNIHLRQTKALARFKQQNIKKGSGGVYDIEGSYSQRCCAVYDESRRILAEIRRKEDVKGVAFGGDVFRLVVQPGFDVAVAMAIVILLEQMFG